MPLEKLPILLNASRADGDVWLRIDEGGWSGSAATELPVLSLRLHGVTAESLDESALYAAVGLECELDEFPSEGGGCEVLLHSNYHVDSVRLVCARTTTSRSAYEYSDLLAKVTWLAQLYAETYDRSETNLVRSHRFRSELDAGLRNLLGRAEKKVEFLAPKGKGQSVQGEVKAYQKALTLLLQLQNESAT